MTDFDPALVDKAARALHAERCCPCDPNGCGAPDPQDYSAARVVLAAVAEWTDNERYDAWHEKSFQRGMVAGARQVYAAVKTEWATRDLVMDTLSAAHEAVARIEKGCE